MNRLAAPGDGGPEFPLVPPATLGMLGGGQLGRMSGMAARHMGYGLVAAARHRAGPCGQVADRVLVTDFAHELTELAAALSAACDVATYEWENVPASLARALAERVPVRPSPELLETAQDRLVEKERLRAAGVRTAPFHPVRRPEELEEALAAVGLPAVLKTTRGGYDGKGQAVIRRAGEARSAYASLGGADGAFILEAFIPFAKELSVIVARDVGGEVAVFPVAENVHRAQILHLSLVPARVPPRVQAEAQAVGRRVAEGLELVGVLGVELFLVDGTILVNELAPRPHNSGHYSLDACRTSQFEQHVRAVCGLPLAEPGLHTGAVMLNILGQHLAPLRDSLPGLLDAERMLKLHLYGKDEARRDRKMGHFTLLCDDPEDGLARLEPVWRAMGEGGPLLGGEGPAGRGA